MNLIILSTANPQAMPIPAHACLMHCMDKITGTSLTVEREHNNLPQASTWQGQETRKLLMVALYAAQGRMLEYGGLDCFSIVPKGSIATL